MKRSSQFPTRCSPFRSLAWLPAVWVVALAGAPGCSSGSSPSDTGVVAESGAVAAASFTESGLERISEAIRADIAGEQIAGAVALLASAGEIQFFESFGARDREAGLAMTNDAIFALASMTKPITSFAVMMLHEAGHFDLDDPVSTMLPELGSLDVGVEERTAGSEPALRTVPAERDMTIRDLLRHTSGLTYGLFGDSRVDRMYGQAQLLGGNGNTLADLVTGLGELPLKHQPGARFEYSVSTDVLGRLVEVVSGMRFDEFLQQQIFEPLRMVDTGFRVPMAKRGRLALTYNRGGDGLVPQPVGNIAETPSFLSGGGGLYSTATDYLRFCQMVLNGGELDGVRVASTETVALMTSDHLGDRPGGILGLVEGFGLGFAVRRDLGAPPHGSVGELSWAGIRSTTFWIDPEKQIIGIYLTQLSPFDTGHGHRFRVRAYEALAE